MFIRPQTCVCPSNQTSRASKEHQQTSRPWKTARRQLRPLSVPCPRWKPVQDHLADCRIPMGSRSTSSAGHRGSGSGHSRKSRKHTKVPNIPTPWRHWREKLNGGCQAPGECACRPPSVWQIRHLSLPTLQTSKWASPTQVWGLLD